MKHVALPPRPRKFFDPGSSVLRWVVAGGFTLVEMLVVLSIIAILTVFAAPAVRTILQGSQLTQSAQLLIGELALGKQYALSKNCSVEVRFYQWADPSMAGETANSASTGKYRAVQMFAVTKASALATTPTYVALDKVQRLPNAIIIDSGSTLSNLISTGISRPAAPPAQPPPSPYSMSAASQPGPPSLPQAGKNYNYVAFHFSPSGATDLSSSSPWYLTLHNINNGDALSTPPQNFFTLQIYATNGHTRNFRP